MVKLFSWLAHRVAEIVVVCHPTFAYLVGFYFTIYPRLAKLIVHRRVCLCAAVAMCVFVLNWNSVEEHSNRMLISGLQVAKAKLKWCAIQAYIGHIDWFQKYCFKNSTRIEFVRQRGKLIG